MSCVIWWVRRDLRLHDNPALRAALASGYPVLPVYIHAPQEAGAAAPGGAARWWEHHSLAGFSQALANAGSVLVIRRGESLAQLRELVHETGAGAVYWNRLYEPALVARDREVKQALREQGLQTRSLRAALLCEPWTIYTGEGKPYRIFTPFWRKLAGHLEEQAPLPAPERVPGPAQIPESERLDALDLLPQVHWTAGLEATWSPGEAGGLARLEQFAEAGLGQYEQLRDFPARDGVSCLSPWLHHGELSPRQILAAIRDQAGAQPFLRQLGWREFAHYVLFHFPHVVDEPLNPEFRDFPWRSGHAALLRAWQRGRTGYPVVDAGMHQLWHTGWMHNRVRMIVASLLVKHIRAPWQAGARWFMDTLVDADLANNTLGWQWAGGCGADAAPYFRIFNPVRQGQRFDPHGDYVRHWLPALRRVPVRYIHSPWTLPERLQQDLGVRIGRDYPAPVVDLASARGEALAAWRSLRESRQGNAD